MLRQKIIFRFEIKYKNHIFEIAFFVLFFPFNITLYNFLWFFQKPFGYNVTGRILCASGSYNANDGCSSLYHISFARGFATTSVAIHLTHNRSFLFV